MVGSLFDRMTRSLTEPPIDEEESIRLHLIRMLTARQGSVQSLPDYGLPDLNDLTLSRAELINATCLAIQRCIEKYEPRLVSVRVTHLPSGEPAAAFTIEVRITAMKIGAHGAKEPCDYNLSLDGNKVRGLQ